MEVGTEGYTCMGKMLFGLHGLMAVCVKSAKLSYNIFGIIKK